MRAMEISPALPRPRIPLLIALGVATVLAAWLRAYGIGGQVLIDDEWHAVHKLLSSSYSGIFRTFGMADHSIPLTLLYKAMAQAVGLDEINMRALQVACGIALVPLAAWLAWRATGDAPAAALFAFLLCGAPFLVLYSRFARPYAISLLFTVICLALLWRWRTERTRRLAWQAAASAALAAWMHPLAGLYVAIGCLFVFFEDVLTRRDVRPPPALASLKLGILVAAAMAVLLAAPAVHDMRSISGKTGGDQPGWETYERMLSIFWGGLPAPAVAVACALAALGVAVVWRRNARLAAYLALLGLAPVAVVTLLGAHWAHQGQTFGRYVLPLQVILLAFGSVGAVSLVRAAARSRAEPFAWGSAAILSAAYLAATPSVAMVATLGPWYGHPDYHWDYRYRWNVAKRSDGRYEPPDFYRELARLPEGSAPLIEAPFSFEHNMLGYYATYHRQPQVVGLLHDLCLEGARIGEPPHDRRFRFGKFVHLDDAASVGRSGARYLLLHRERINARPFQENGRCIDRLTALYGPPLRLDARLAVFDLQRGMRSAQR